MGSKSNPGKFDCYANAESDEPMFVLLGRDKFAASLVDLWATAREIDGETAEKVGEAKDCAAAIRNHVYTLRKRSVDVLDLVPAQFLVAALSRRGYGIALKSPEAEVLDALAAGSEMLETGQPETPRH